MNAITINAKSRTIELSNAFSKAASLFGSEEYRQLQEARRDYPSYRVITRKQKNARKAFSTNLRISFMDKYIANHDVSDKLKAEYRTLRGLDENGSRDETVVAADYQTIKDWFLNNFHEFEDYLANRQALLEKIEADKKDRLAARKRPLNPQANTN